ncbi:MAG: hypothetical protein ABWY57_10960 [Mycetocola sp.]
MAVEVRTALLRARTVVRAVLVGAVCGLAWSAGFRAYMMEIAGPASRFDWFGTFGTILAPGILVGVSLSLAGVLRSSGRPRGTWLLVLSPLVFAVAPMLRPGALADFLTTGLGGGAVGIAAIAILGGYSLGDVGPVWSRVVCGTIAWSGAVATAATIPLLGPARVALTQPRGAWATLLAFTFVAVLIVANSLPLRNPKRTAETEPI